MLELALVLREAGVEVEVLAPAHAGLASHEVLGVPVHRYHYFDEGRATLDRAVGEMRELSGRRDLALPALSLVGAGTVAAAKLVREKDYDVIHSHWPLPNGLMVAAGRRVARNDPRQVATFHGAEVAMARGNRFLAKLLARITKNLDGAIANSSHTASLVRELTGVEPDVIPLAAPRSATNRRFSVKPPGDEPLPTVLAVGRMIERKGFPVLVRAATRLRGRARVVIVGDGEARPAVEKEIQRAGTADVVRLVGQLPNDELANLYGRCAVFCLPAVVDSRGYTEALGVVLIEAMEHGKPVVASRLGGIPDVVEHGVTGLLVPSNDPGALADALLHVVETPVLANRLGEAGRERARRLFCGQDISRRHLEVYGAVDRAVSASPR